MEYERHAICTYIVNVTKLQSSDDLVENPATLAPLEAAWRRVEMIEERFFDEFEDEVESSLASEHLQQVDQILVPQLLCTRNETFT